MGHIPSVPTLQKSNELIPRIAIFKGSRYVFQSIILWPSMFVFGGVTWTPQKMMGFGSPISFFNSEDFLVFFFEGGTGWWWWFD